jgi:tetratricopeptide (TPR) repeat protein
MNPITRASPLEPCALTSVKTFQSIWISHQRDRIKTNLAAAYYNRGIVLKSLGKTETAIADFTKARATIWSKPLPQYIRQK